MNVAARAAAALALAWAGVGTANAQESPPSKPERLNAPGCIALKDAAPHHDPADLFRAANACIAARRYDDGARLYMLGAAYGRFDTLRVSDTTRHQAVMDLWSATFDKLPAIQWRAFQASLQRLSEGKPKRDLCAAIAQVGPPTYYPRYMIDHGTDAAVAHKDNELVGKFDSDAAWIQVRTEYLKCEVR